MLHHERIADPAEEVGATSRATFSLIDRSLRDSKIRVLLKVIDKVATLSAIRLDVIGDHAHPRRPRLSGRKTRHHGDVQERELVRRHAG